MISQRLRETLRFFLRYLGALLLVTAPFALLSQGIQEWQGGLVVANEDGEIQRVNAVALLLMLLIRPFTDAALTYQLGAIQAGGPRPLSQCLLGAATQGPWVLAAYMIIALALITPLMLLGPLMAAVSPQAAALLFSALALWISARLSLTPFLVVLESRDVLESVKQSFMRTREWQWPLLASLLITGLLAAVVLQLLAQGLLTLAGDNLFSGALIGLLGGLASALVMVLIFRFYVLSCPTRPGDSEDA